LGPKLRTCSALSISPRCPARNRRSPGRSCCLRYLLGVTTWRWTPASSASGKYQSGSATPS